MGGGKEWCRFVVCPYVMLAMGFQHSATPTFLWQWALQYGLSGSESRIVAARSSSWGWHRIPITLKPQDNPNKTSSPS